MATPHPLPIAAWALSWIAGAALQLRQPELSPATVYAAVVALGVALALVAWRLPPLRAWGGALAAASIAFGATGLRADGRLAERLDAALEGRDLVVTGVVAELPRLLPDGTRFAFEPDHATLGGQAVRVPPRLSLGWYRGFDEDEARLLDPQAQLRAGQRWQFTVRLKRNHGLANPHGFDQELWAFERRLGATGSVRATERSPARLLDPSVGRPIERARQSIRDAITARVADPRSAGVLAALAVGDQAAIERSDWALFRDTGIAHLVSISGLHVTMFAWLAGAAVGWLWCRSARAMHALPAPLAARWGGLAVATAYALLAGWGVPAQRTLLMIATAALLATLGLRWPALLTLLAAAVVVTAVDPWALLQPGFWLSFVAVGLLFAAHPHAPAAAPAGRASALKAALRAGLRTQAVATLGLAPLTLLFFQQLSLVGFVANLVAIPVVTLVITPLALIGMVLPPLWLIGAAVVNGLSVLLTALGTLPWAVWTAPVAPWWAQLAGLAGGALAVLPLPWALRALAIPLLLPLLAPTVERPPLGAMQVIVADVGQGSAIVLRTHARVLVHDAGAQYSRDSDAGLRVLVPLLRAVGATPVDLLVLSHRDNDHVGGAASLLAALPVRAMSSSLEPGHPLRAGPRPHQRCEAGQAWDWDGVSFRVLHPSAADYERPNAKPNTLSCVLAIRDAQGHRVLLTGDLEAEQEERLVRDHADEIRADVLLVPHHGSKTSSSAAFLDAVEPKIALVQAGYRNRFGHPAPEVVARYAARGIALVGSVECGAWTASSDGPARCERRSSRRYWHHGLEVAPSGSLSNEGESARWPSMSR